MRIVRHMPAAGTAIAALVILVAALAALVAATAVDGPALPEKTRPLLVLPQPRG